MADSEKASTNLEHINQYETYPSFLLVATAVCTLLLVFFILLPVIYYRDVKALQNRYNVDLTSNSRYYILSPLLFHGISVVFYLRWRQRRLQETYGLSESEIEDEKEKIGQPTSKPIVGLLYTEAFLVFLAILIIIFSLPLTLFYGIGGLLILLGVTINPILVYQDLKRLDNSNLGWESFKSKVIILILSVSVAFLLGYIITRNLRIWTAAFNSLRFEKKEVGNTTEPAADFKDKTSTLTTKEEERNSTGSIFEEKDER